MDNIKITFLLEGAGLIYDKYNPIHFDALLDWLLSPMCRTEEPPERTGKPQDIALPLLSKVVNGHRVYCASALFPEGGVTETIQYFRTKYPQEYHEFCKGTANLQSGVTRDHNRPYQVTLTDRMVCYCVGKKKRIRKALYRVNGPDGLPLPEKRLMLKGLGLKRHMGLGGISDIIVEKVDYDWSLVRDGKAMRYLPTTEGMRTCRIRPPYWNLTGMAQCCDVGDDV